MIHAYLECGKILNTHGIRGCLKVESYCDSPDILASLPAVYLLEHDQYVRKAILHASKQKGFVLLTLEGIDSVEAAESLKNQVLFAARENLPVADNAVFIADLIGLPVIDADTGVRYGTMSGVTNPGGGDLYLIDTPSGEKMIPAVPDFIARADPEHGLFIRPIPGLLD